MKKIILILVFFANCLLPIANCVATNVSGGIYSNTTWSLINSPYIVTDTVVVFPGVTLTIEAGVVVKFADHKYIEIRQANLIAIGTALDSITFTSNNGSPTPGIWGSVNGPGGGIWLNGVSSTTNAKFYYCNIRYATRGISDFGQDSIQIKYSNISHNLIGMYGNNSSHHDIIDYSDFTYNTTYGIATVWADSINFCTISYNQAGFYQSSSHHIYNCIINNNQTGLGGATEIRIYFSTLKFNQTGFSSGGDNVIKNCSIDSNTVTGITLGVNDSLINSEIKYNGIGIDGGWLNYGTWIISRCIIENNITGIKAGTNLANIYCNKICNNTSYDLYYNVVSSSNASFPNNYWCSTDSATISSHIYDGYDNISLGLVSFFPIDTIGCYLTGCNINLTTTTTNATCGTCANGSASVSVANGFAPYTYTWNTSPIQTTAHATGLLPGTYTVCVVDANGCTACHAVTVDSINCSTFHIVASAINSTCSTCSDGSGTVIATGGTSPYNYTWYSSPMQYTGTATNLLAGIYAVCVLDAGGCILCDSVTIGTGNCSAHFSLSPDTIPHHYFATNMASGVPPLTYDWSWGDASPDDHVPYPNHTYAAAGYYTICLTIHDSVGCGDMYCNSYYLLRTENAMVYVNVLGNSFTTNVGNISGLNHCTIYPNPNDGNFSVSNVRFTIYDLRITDVYGRKVYSHHVSDSQGKETIAVPLSKGIYFWEIITPDGVIDKGKIIIE